MNLRQELEMLRGEPITDKVPAEKIPFNETSDREKLCKHPVVSVRMITYNHAKYIAQAIEGVMMQKTDFEFELIVSDDCSPDGTRQIAEEYQKKYPDKIRVLWWTENQHKFGGNITRAWTVCRGEFIALCEGDDYWIDPLKLQKQVDAMRANPGVSLCAGDIKSLNEDIGNLDSASALKGLWREGVTPRDEAFADAKWLPTCTLMLRTSAYKAAKERFDVFNWCLVVGDVLLWNAMSYFGDVYVFHDYFGVYRSHQGGATRSIGPQILRDSGVISSYFAIKTGEKSVSLLYRKLTQIITGRCRMTLPMPYKKRKEAIAAILKDPTSRTIAIAQYGMTGMYFMRFGKPFWFYIRVRNGLRRRFEARW